jgi:hypothetical protein
MFYDYWDGWPPSKDRRTVEIVNSTSPNYMGYAYYWYAPFWCW